MSSNLDKIHSEKDPYIKYDSNEKKWRYLHINRTPEQFCNLFIIKYVFLDTIYTTEIMFSHIKRLYPDHGTKKSL